MKRGVSIDADMLNPAYLNKVSMEAVIDRAAENNVRKFGHAMRLLRKQAKCTATALYANTTERDLTEVAFCGCWRLEIVKLVAVATKGMTGWRAIIQVECIFRVNCGILDGDGAAPTVGIPRETSRTWTSKAIIRRF